MKEAEFKSIFKKSVRAQKGFSISLSAPLVIGTPDLYVIIPGYIPVLLEAKWLGDVCEGFSRKIPYTALQKDFINNCNDVHQCTAFGLIGYRYLGETWCTMTVHDKVEMNTGDHFALVQPTKLFNVIGIFGVSGVPRLNGAPS